MDKIQSKFNLENLAEFSLEFNPYPKEEIYELINILNQKYN